MKKIDFPLWSDTLFFFGCVWLAGLCVFRFYSFSVPAALILCSLTACAAATVFFLFFSKIRKKKFLSVCDREEKEMLALHLALSSEEKNRVLLAPLLAADEKNFLFFTLQPLSADEIAKTIRKTDGKFNVYCNELSPQAQELCERFPIKIIDGIKIYTALKEKNLLPERYLCGEKQRKNKRNKLRICFRSRNARSFFISGAALLALSLFSFFPVYYLISGGILLLAALFIRIFGYR